MPAIIVTNDFPPDHGGIQRYMARLADGLAERRFDVRVVAPVSDGAEAYDRSQSYRVLRYKPTSKLGNVLGMVLQLLVAVRSGRGDVIASLWFPAGFAALMIPRAFRGRLAVLVHGAEIRPSRGGFRRRLMRFVLDRADVVIANSTYTKTLVEKAGITRAIEVVHCGVDAIAVEPQPGAIPLVLAVGRLVRRKGFDRLLSSLPQVALAIPNVRCEIVGDGPERAELEALATSLGVAERVTFLGAVPDDELARAYARAWCFALPVRNDDEDVEGFGIVYLEAAMASLPTIGGARSGAEDAILHGETGLLIDGNDPHAVGAAIVELLGDPERARAMGRRGRERALRDFTWAGAIAKIVATLP